MPPAKAQSWNEVLDNLGENLIRLGTSLSSLAETPSAQASETVFAQALGTTASGFRVAFRQARPALAAGEKVFLQLAHASTEELLSSHSVGESSQVARAHTLVHEGVLVCQEMVVALNQVEHAAQTHPKGVRRTFAPSLRVLAETTASAGWEVRTVCHEYAAEVRLSETKPAGVRELALASMGLLLDMTAAASSLRSARREWFRVGEQLAAMLGGGPEA
jgi:hypothetical protein